MEAKKNLLTYAGLKKLEDELHDLKVVKRKEVAEKIKEAREQGDLSENAEYDAAKDEQRDIELRIEEIEKILKNAEVVVEDEVDEGKINVGCKVKVLDMEYDDLLDIITLNNPSDTRILEVTANTDDPYVAKEIVDEIGKVSADRIKSIMGVEPPTTVEYGHVADEKSSPSLVKNTALGFLAGIFGSSFIIIALYLLNNTISSEDDVEKYLGLNNLGIIPIEEGSVEQMMRDKKKRKRQKQKAGVKHE